MARFTRREVAILVAASPFAAQTVPPKNKPPFKPAPRTVEQAVQDVREVSDKLRSFDLPMSVEPAFSFRV